MSTPPTYNDYTGDGSNTFFPINFEYLEDEHVTVAVDGVDTSAFTINTDQPTKRVEMTTAPGIGANVRVRRKSQRDTDLVDFENGSVLTESELDRAYRHNRYLHQEIGELNDASLQKKQGSNNFTAKNNKIVDLADPTDPQDAATKNYVDTADALKVDKAGDSMTGALAMGGNKITGLGAPTLSDDAATKTYVDGSISSAVTGTGLPPSFDKFTGTGSQTTFSLTFTTNGTASSSILVAIDGEVIDPDDYTISGGADEIEFTTPPPLNSEVLVIERGFKVKTDIPTEYDWGSVVGDPVTANYSYGQIV